MPIQLLRVGTNEMTARGAHEVEHEGLEPCADHHIGRVLDQLTQSAFAVPQLRAKSVLVRHVDDHPQPPRP